MAPDPPAARGAEAQKETIMTHPVRCTPASMTGTHHFYRATAKARLPGTCEAVHGASVYLYDVLLLCLRGAWDLELAQFMPPVSLQGSVNALLEMGLIERVDDPPEPLSSRVPVASPRAACAPRFSFRVAVAA
jgi:hypothetical protein